MKSRPFFRVGMGVFIWLAGLGGSLPPARAALLFYEPFAYAGGTQLNKLGQNGWNLGNSSGTGSPFVTNAAALTYSGLVTSNGSLGLMINGSPSSNRDAGTTNFPTQTLDAGNPSVYLSFLLNVRSPTTEVPNRMLVALSSKVSTYPTSTMVDGVFIDASNQLWVADGSTAASGPSTAPLGAGTHLVVARYLWTGGSSSEVDLWVDPLTTLGAPETNVPPPTISTTAGASVSSVQALYITTITTDNGAYYFDELRLGTAWADVTPTLGQPISATNSTFTVSPAVVPADGTSAATITVTEYDNNGNALTNNGFAPTLAAMAGQLNTNLVAQGYGVWTTTWTATKPGYASVSGTIAGSAIGTNGSVSVYFAGPIGTNGVVSTAPGFFPGTDSFNFTGAPGQTFSVWSSTNMALPMAQWTRETDLATGNQTMYETTYAGQPSAYSFTVQPPATGPIFYRVSSP